VSPSIVELAADDAEVINVGHRGGHGRIVPVVHPLVLERARAGKQVVRLKSGDPMVFGRGAEEAEELERAGIPFEFVPGISAALGAAASCGIPLTDRRYSSRVTLTTGRVADHAILPRAETLILYMVASRLADKLDELIASGWDASIPAVYISSVTTRREQKVFGTIGDLGSRVKQIRDNGPSLVMVGEVVKLGELAAQTRVQPLRGRKILVARARPGRSRIGSELRALGASVCEFPNITSYELQESFSIADRMRAIDTFDAVVFGCAEGVDIVVRRNRIADYSHSRIIAIGQRAAAALEGHRISPGLILKSSCRDELLEHVPQLKGKRLILIRGQSGCASLQGKLESVGASVDSYVIYQHEVSFPEVALAPELLVLPSSSAAILLLERDSSPFRSLPTIVIDERTKITAESLGVRRVIKSRLENTDSLIESVVGTLSEGSTCLAPQRARQKDKSRAI
jgi:uroporphyrinogen III methyltransferase / synthase